MNMLIIKKKVSDYVTIKCPIHGEFKQLGTSHLSGQGCPKCGVEKMKQAVKYSDDEIKEICNKIHNNKYDYSLVDYKKQHPYIEIICPKHGNFKQLLYLHMQGCGCPECSFNYPKTQDDFIQKAKEIHKNEENLPIYDYSKVNFKNMRTKVSIICPTHGEFLQLPPKHLNGQGCPKCANQKRVAWKILTTKEFIKKAQELHGDLYDYSEVIYERSNRKVKITCKKCGSVVYSTPNNHLRGNGCPRCHKSKLETYVISRLVKENIKFTYRFRAKWLQRMELDFYLPDYNIAIECQGCQHFHAYERFGGEEGFKSQIKRDELKKKLSEENGIKLLYFAKSKYGRDDIITSEDELIEIIKKTPLNNSNSI